MQICKNQNIKGEKKMAKPITDILTGSNVCEKHNLQSGTDKQDPLITHNDL